MVSRHSNGNAPSHVVLARPSGILRRWHTGPTTAGLIVLLMLALTAMPVYGFVTDFEDLLLDPNTYWNGSDGMGHFFSGNARLDNDFNVEWYSWDGFAYSNMADTAASGWSAQYHAIPGSGADGSDTYAIGYVGWSYPPTLRLDNAGIVESLAVTNSNYAYYSMRDGDAFAKRFGDPCGTAPDWFLLTITGHEADGTITGTADTYLADYRFTDPCQDYILDTWQTVDLTSLGVVQYLTFSLTSSDIGDWGMNTPAYFAIDSVNLLEYAPAAETTGSTAIHMNDPNTFAAWATGYENYLVGADCDATWQSPEKALGQAVGDSMDIVSLGRGGEITLTFDSGIGDGAGYDFAVFENGFGDTFLELAYVEVSSDGIHYFRLGNDSLTDEPVGGFGTVDPTAIGGYCSKYRQGYGTPFDLAQLRGVDPLLDITNVTHVRLIDVVGDGTALDTTGDIIYDPSPTTGSAGVDIDAIGVIHPRSGDLTGDGIVDTADLAYLTEGWLTNSYSPGWDATRDMATRPDGNVNLDDFAVLARQWGLGTTP